MTLPSPRPAIGVFDSGVGGLSVLREIRRLLPFEDLHYVADSAFAPYGDRSAAYIAARTRAIAQFLLTQHVKALVVACNTATSVAVDALRKHINLPIVAIEPAIKPAVGQTRSGVVGVLATRQTAGSASVSKLVAKYGQDVRILLQACPGLVEQVEKGALATPETQALLNRYITPLLNEGADTLVLGCTHYPFLTPLIQEIAGKNVQVIDPAPAVAQQLQRRLMADELLAPPDLQREHPRATGQTAFWTSGSPEQASRVMSVLWGQPVHAQALPEGYCQSPVEG
ncbi:MAG: MurI1: glutamate racemase [Pseudomonadota bacterium]|jgi:glutamate racemase